MNAHVPDLERCKRLKEAGFPGHRTLLVYADAREAITREAFEQWILNTKEPIYEPLAAPIVTELVEACHQLFRESKDPFVFEIMGWLGNSTTNITVTVYTDFPLKKTEIEADTLPNALADLWLWAKKGGA